MDPKELAQLLIEMHQRREDVLSRRFLEEDIRIPANYRPTGDVELSQFWDEDRSAATPPPVNSGVTPEAYQEHIQSLIDKELALIDEVIAAETGGEFSSLDALREARPGAARAIGEPVPEELFEPSMTSAGPAVGTGPDDISRMDAIGRDIKDWARSEDIRGEDAMLIDKPSDIPRSMLRTVINKSDRRELANILTSAGEPYTPIGTELPIGAMLSGAGAFMPGGESPKEAFLNTRERAAAHSVLEPGRHQMAKMAASLPLNRVSFPGGRLKGGWLGTGRPRTRTSVNPGGTGAAARTAPRTKPPKADPKVDIRRAPGAEDLPWYRPKRYMSGLGDKLPAASPFSMRTGPFTSKFKGGELPYQGGVPLNLRIARLTAQNPRLRAGAQTIQNRLNTPGDPYLSTAALGTASGLTDVHRGETIGDTALQTALRGAGSMAWGPGHWLGTRWIPDRAGWLGRRAGMKLLPGI